MVNQNIVKAKIGHIEGNLQRLREKRKISLEELTRSIDLQDIILHNLQLSIQGCIDIASHIISDQGWTVPGTLAGLFDILSEHKVISLQLSEKLKKMTGFRNLIIHEYQTIDLNRVHNILSRDIKDIDAFLRRICVYAKL